MAHDMPKPFFITLSLIIVLLAGCSTIAAPREPSVAPVAAVTTALPHVTRAPIRPTETAAPTAPPAPTLTASATVVPTVAATAVTPTVSAVPVDGALVLGRGAVPERLYAVMIDNHPAAYPQSGLNTAPLVFETLAEFGVTRYMAVFAPGISPAAAVIGPVRSARSYFVQWAIGLGAIYAHAGGSPDGLALAESAPSIVNADALRKDAGSYFRRDRSRVAPHNLYTDSRNLARIVADRHAANVDLSAIGFILKPDAPLAQRPRSQQLGYYFLYKEESAGWVYDTATNAYKRLRRGAPHVDGQTGRQLVFKNVVVMEVAEAKRADDAKGRIDQEVLGEGAARIFTDGKQIEGRWRKDADTAPLRFYDLAGNEVAFNVGPIWIAAVPALSHLRVDGGTAS